MPKILSTNTSVSYIDDGYNEKSNISVKRQMQVLNATFTINTAYSYDIKSISIPNESDFIVRQVKFCAYDTTGAILENTKIRDLLTFNIHDNSTDSDWSSDDIDCFLFNNNNNNIIGKVIPANTVITITFTHVTVGAGSPLITVPIKATLNLIGDYVN